MKTCRKCGKALEMTHVVLGRTYTHPCACDCMIQEFERTHYCAGRRKHEIHRVRETGGKGEAEDDQKRPHVHA